VTTWLGVAIAFGPLALLALWMALLNRRDRRRDALEGTVGFCCAELRLRAACAVHARVGTLFGGVRVVLDMRLCTPAQVWKMIERLSPRLPPGAKLCIVATGPRRPPSSVRRQDVDVRLLAGVGRAAIDEAPALTPALAAGAAQAGGIAPVRSTISR
jgi:hypothetical protein